MLGRQAGYFLIVACQRPDAKYFSDGIRDNFNFRVGLGRISELGLSLIHIQMCIRDRASYDEIPKATQDEVFAGAKAFVKENKGRYECGGYIYSDEGQELGPVSYTHLDVYKRQQNMRMRY